MIKILAGNSRAPLVAVHWPHFTLTVNRLFKKRKHWPRKCYWSGPVKAIFFWEMVAPVTYSYRVRVPLQLPLPYMLVVVPLISLPW